MTALRHFGAKPAGYAIVEPDTKHIIRQWNREIEAEIRRERSRERDSGPWKAVVWAALWLLWLGALVALLGHLKG